MGVKLSGISEMKRALEKQAKVEQMVCSVVKLNGAELQERAQRNAPVDTGNLRRSISLSVKDGGMTAEVTATADYSAYVEYGTRYMEAQPYMQPAFNVQKDIFVDDLKRALKNGG